MQLSQSFIRSKTKEEKGTEGNGHLKHHRGSVRSTDQESSTFSEHHQRSEIVPHLLIVKKICLLHWTVQQILKRNSGQKLPEIPSLVLDQDHYIEVFVGGDSQDNRGLLHVSIEEYFTKLHHREGYSSVQNWSLLIKKKNQAVGVMRDFWRNKIVEQQSYGGKMVLAALRRDTFSQ